MNWSQVKSETWKLVTPGVIEFLMFSFEFTDFALCPFVPLCLCAWSSHQLYPYSPCAFQHLLKPSDNILSFFAYIFSSNGLSEHPLANQYNAASGGEWEQRGQVFILHSPLNSVKNEDLTPLLLQRVGQGRDIDNPFSSLINIISHVGLFPRWYRFCNAWQYQPAALKAAGSFSNQFRPSALRYSLFNIPQIVLLCLMTLAKIRQYIFTILPLPVNLACKRWMAWPTTTVQFPHIFDNIPSAPGSLEEALAALKEDHAFLLKGDVFTQDIANLGWRNFAKVSQSLQELYVLIEKSFFAMRPKTC